MNYFPRPRLTKANYQHISNSTDSSHMNQKESLARSLRQQRSEGINQWYKEGGTLFLNWTKKYYRRWSGEELEWTEPFFEEFFIIFGNPWLERIIVEKSAQIGYSESCIAFAAFCLSHVRISVGFGFEQNSKARQFVGTRIQPAFDNCKPIQDLSKIRKLATKRDDIDSKEKITVGSVSLSIFYSSTSATKTGKEGERQAPSALSSWEGWAAICDEIELWPDKSLDLVVQRQNACKMPTKPLRGGSTPGQEGGIVDREIKAGGYLFQWQIKCSKCGHIQFLDAFGNFLKPVVVEEDDNLIESFVDKTGRPLDWFCKDNSSREKSIETAYIGCSHCGEELDVEDINNGKFCCRNTNISGLELCKDTVTNQQAVINSVGIRLPRLASRLFIPSKQIRRLLITRNPSDELQQGLGKSVSVGSGKISLDKLRRCVQEVTTDIQPTIIMGVDQGRAANFVEIQKWYFDTSIKNAEERWLSAKKQVVWYGQVPGGFEALDILVSQWQVRWIGIDADPEIQLSTAYARKHIPHKSKSKLGEVFLFDQVELKGEEVRRSNRDVQGVAVTIYSLHRTFGLDAVRNRIYRGLQYFPLETEYIAGDDNCLFSHYLVSERTLNGRWTAPDSAQDHWFHADNFAEMAAYCQNIEPQSKVSFSSFSVVRENK